MPSKFFAGVTDLGSVALVCAHSSPLFVAALTLTVISSIIAFPEIVRVLPWCIYTCTTHCTVCAQTHSVGEEHEEHEKLMASVQAGMDTLLGSSDESRDDATRATVLAELKANLSKFGKDVLEHLDHEEYSFATPIARKVT